MSGQNVISHFKPHLGEHGKVLYWRSVGKQYERNNHTGQNFSRLYQHNSCRIIQIASHIVVKLIHPFEILTPFKKTDLKFQISIYLAKTISKTSQQKLPTNVDESGRPKRFKMSMASRSLTSGRGPSGFFFWFFVGVSTTVWHPKTLKNKGLHP